MTSVNPLNVYAGPDAVQKYFDPSTTLLPLIEIPQELNPYYGDGVRIFAKMMSMHPANNVKLMPGECRSLLANPRKLTRRTAMNMLSKGVEPGKTRTVVEYSSGSTVISLALASRVYHGIRDCRAFLSNKTTVPKLRLMQFFGLDM